MKSKLRLGVVFVTLFTLLLMFNVQPSRAQGANLLANPSFEDGHYFQDGIPELATPNGWRLHYIDGSTFPEIAEGAVARRPESVVWLRSQAPAHEQNVLWIDGNYNVKLFKPWAPVYIGMSQTVQGLTPGQQYEFVARVYVDIVQGYVNGVKIYPTNEPEGVGIRLGASLPGASWRNASQINYGGFAMQANTSPFHQSWVTMRHRFTASGSSMTVWVEMYSRYGYDNNGFFLDNFELIPIGGQVSQPQPTNPPQPTNTPQPQATAAPTSAPAPTATPQQNYIQYRVQPGDHLTRIARQFGVSVTELARINNIRNTSLIFVGTVLRVPSSNGSPVAGPTAAPTQPPASGPAPTATPSTSSVLPPSNQQTYTVQPGDRLSTIARTLGVPYQLLLQANRLTNPNLIYAGQVLVVPDTSRIYTVQQGDSLRKIADRFGITWELIAAANNLRNANVIYPGQTLIIP